MQRLLQIARKDFEDAIRERELYVAGALFVLVGIVIGYLAGSDAGNTPATLVPRITLGALVFVGGLGSISLSYNRLVGKRASGELRVLLSLPYSRSEVVYGTFAGRWAFLMTMATTTLVLAGAVAVGLGAPVDGVAFVGAVVAATAIVSVFVSLAVGLSAASANTTRAAAGAFGLFILFLFRLWDLVPWSIRFLLNGLSAPRGSPPGWERFWGQIAPIAGLRNAVADAFPSLTSVLNGWAPSVPASTSPLYAEPWFGALVVLAWIVGPVTLGYLRLKRADL